MSMEVILDSDPRISVGESIKTEINLKLDEPQKMWYGGVTLLSLRPCGKSFQLLKDDLFSEGIFTPGQYIRRRDLMVSPRVVPTNADLKISYAVRTNISFKEAEKPEISVFDEKTVEIIGRPPVAPNSISPSEISLRGMKVQLQKDIFKPGEEIHVSYQIEPSAGINQIEAKLIQIQETSCSCPSFRNICSHITPNSEKTIKRQSIDEPTLGSLKIQIPESVSDTHDYQWTSDPLQSHNMLLDRLNWTIRLEGKRQSGQALVFDVPIRVYSDTPKIAPSDQLFVEGRKGLEPYLQRAIKRIRHERQGKDKNLFKLRNEGPRSLEGVTIKVAGIKRELFETRPQMAGYGEWKEGEELSICYETKHIEDISGFQFILEANGSLPHRIAVKP